MSLRRQLWIANAVVVCAVVGAATAIGVVALGGATEPPAAEPAPPAARRLTARPAVGAYAIGGAPLRDADVEAVLRDRLPALVVATDDDRASGGTLPGRRLALTEALLAPPALAAHGPALARAWGGLVAALDRWASSPERGRDFTARSGELREAAGAVSDELAAAGLAYYVEADVVAGSRGPHALIYAYRVETVAFVRAGGEPRRALELRRLDDLNYEHTLLGMQADDRRDPLVLLDQIDEHVRDELRPIVELGGPYPLGDEAWARTPEGRAIREAAATAVRAELGRDPITPRMIATVRRHEVQHGLDAERAERGAPARYPPPLAQLIGPATDPTGAPRVFAEHCRNELSAYTSQLANDPATPKTAYFHLASFAFDRASWGAPEAIAAVLVTTGLARHLGAPAAPLIHAGGVDRGALAAAGLAIAAATPDALREAARATWHDFYDEDLTAIVDR